MKKAKKKRSIATSLTRRIVLILIITMGLTSYLLYTVSTSFIEEEECNIYSELLDNANQKIRRVLSDVYLGAINHIDDIEENLDKPDRLKDIMENIVNTNPRIRSCGISFIADYYPKKGHWFAPYAKREEDGTITKKIIGDKNHDYLKATWFLEAKEAKEGYWSKPFFEGGDSIVPLVSYLEPIRDKHGKTVAVLGADLSLDWLSTQLKKMSKTDIRDFLSLANSCFIIDNDGTYIVHTDSTRILKDNFYKHVEATPDTLDDYVAKMIKGQTEKGFFFENENEEKLIIDGRKVCVFYHSIKHTDWTIGLIVPLLSIKIMGFAFGFVLLFLIAIGTLVVYLMGRYSIKRALRPLKLLADSADEVAKGHFDTRLPEVKKNNEIKTLRDSFEEMQHSLTRYVEDLKTTTAQNAAIENELKIASDIQMSMLPKTYPPYPERKDIDIYGQLKPAKEVGGDLFDFFIHDEKLFFCIGDVSGKGVPASLVMAVTRSLFRNVSAHTSAPHHIMTAINEAMSENNDTGMFVTCFVGVLDLSNGHLSFCNAGHEAPMLIGQGVGLLNCDPNLPIGVIAGQEYTLQETVIHPMTTIFLYTDGLNEAENIRHEQFGDNRVAALAESLLERGKTQPQTLIRNMTTAVREFVDHAEQSDDLTMLAIQYIK